MKLIVSNCCKVKDKLVNFYLHQFFCDGTQELLWGSGTRWWLAPVHLVSLTLNAEIQEIKNGNKKIEQLRTHVRSLLLLLSIICMPVYAGMYSV